MARAAKMKELERLGIVYPQALRLYTILAKNSESLCSSVSAPSAPQAIGDQVPDGHENDRAEQCPDNGYSIDADITNTRDENDPGHQPDTDECRNDCSNETQGQSPTYNSYSAQAHDSCDTQ